MYKKVHNNIEYGGQTFTDSHILFLTSSYIAYFTSSYAIATVHENFTSIKTLNFDMSRNDVVIVAEMNEKRNPCSYRYSP